MVKQSGNGESDMRLVISRRFSDATAKQLICGVGAGVRNVPLPNVLAASTPSPYQRAMVWQQLQTGSCWLSLFRQCTFAAGNLNCHQSLHQYVVAYQRVSARKKFATKHLRPGFIPERILQNLQGHTNDVDWVNVDACRRWWNKVFWPI